MPVFGMCYVCILLFLPMGYSVLFPKNRCSKNDCSYQLTDMNNKTCKIYNTSDLYKFEESSDWTLTFEEESKFSVSVVPYTAEFVVERMTVMRSAINFTFTINNAEINELVVKIFNKSSSKPICRVFNFQNVDTSKHLPINLFYDCLYGLDEHVRMDFIALPGKEKLTYYVFIPVTEDTGSCSWQPLIMIFSGSLRNGVVQVKFSQAPQFHDVSSYVVKLTQYSSGGEKRIEIPPDINRTMLFAQFSSVDDGAYSVSVKPVIWGHHNNCLAETDLFFIEKLKSDHALVIYLCVFILLLFCALVFLKMFRRNILKSKFSSKRRVLLLYSYDCNEHKYFVKSWINYLIKNCQVEVSTIYDELPQTWMPDEANDVLNVNECDPKKWIMEKYKECDIIMFLISAGLFYTLDSEHFLALHKHHEWRNQLLWATNFILIQLLNCAEDIRRKKICKVCFSYSSKEYIPDSLRPGFGKCFILPEEMNTLTNFMHDSWECFLCSKSCDTNLESSFKGTDLCEKIKAVQEAVNSNSHIRIIRPLADTTNNAARIDDLPDEHVQFDGVSESSDENSDPSNIKFLFEIPEAVRAPADSNAHIRTIRLLPDTTNNASSSVDLSDDPVNFDSVSNSSDANSDEFITDILSGNTPKPISRGFPANLLSTSSSDNIRQMMRNVEFAERASLTDSDSDSEESDLLCVQSKFQSKNQIECVLESFLNKNRS